MCQQSKGVPIEGQYSETSLMKSKIRGFTFPEINIYYKATVIKKLY